MSLYKRKDSASWWVKITIPDHPAVQRSTGTADKVKAQEYHDKLAAELWRQSKLGEKPIYYWEDAVLRFLEETKHKRDQRNDILRLRWLYPFFEGKPLQSINRDLIERVMREKPERTPATINRYLAVIRTILRKAEREWDWIDKVPVIRMRIEPKQRIRWITQEEAVLLLNALPVYLADAAEFTLATGLRQRNVFDLEWTQIDMARRCAWIYADQAKGKRNIAVPLNETALSVLRRCLGQHPRYVFTRQGRRIKNLVAKTWQRACQRAGIEDFRWHDLRHTWASWHVQAGTSLQTLMELGGWSSYEMVLRYAHLASHHLHDAAAQIVVERAEKAENVAPPATIQLRCKVIPLSRRPANVR